jgi:hypothetical protein
VPQEIMTWHEIISEHFLARVFVNPNPDAAPKSSGKWKGERPRSYAYKLGKRSVRDARRAARIVARAKQQEKNV